MPKLVITMMLMTVLGVLLGDRQVTLGLEAMHSVTVAQQPSPPPPPPRKRDRLTTRIKSRLTTRSGKTRLTTRSQGLCAIAPGLLGKKPTVWHDRPLFVWKGTAGTVTVRDYATQTILWTTTVATNPQGIQTVRYAGRTPIKAGGFYEWQVVGPNASESDRNQWTTFQRLPAEQWAIVQTDLQTLEDQLVAQGTPKEEIAVQKAEQLATKVLLSDVIQILYEVDNPSASFIEERQEYLNSLCSSAESL